MEFEVGVGVGVVWEGTSMADISSTMFLIWATWSSGYIINK